MNKESKKINDEEIDEFEYDEESDDDIEVESLTKLYLILGSTLALIIIGITIYNMRQIIFANLASFVVSLFFILVLISAGLYYIALPFKEETAGKGNIFNSITIIAQKLLAGVFAIGFIAFGIFIIIVSKTIAFLPIGISFISTGIYIIITKVLPKKSNKHTHKTKNEIVYADNSTIDLVNDNSDDKE